MIAALLTKPGAPLVRTQIRATPLRADEVRVRIAGVGICHTDLLAAEGGIPLPLPAVLGHEGAGTVEAVGADVSDLAVGDAVVLGYDSCGACPNCARGDQAYCHSFRALNYAGTRRDGSTTLVDVEGRPVHGSWFGQSSFATHAIASARNAVRLLAGIDPRVAGPLGCGIQTGAGTIARVLRPREGATVVVFGLGAVGLGAVMAARVAKCGLVVGVEPNASRHAIARELGCHEVIAPDDPSTLVRRLRELASAAGARRGFDLAIDSVGAEPVIQACLAALASPGTCATLGLRGAKNPITIDQSALLNGRTLTGVIEGGADPQSFLPELMRWHLDGQFPFDRLIEHFPFERLDDALLAARSGSVIKPVLTFDHEARQ